MAGELEYRLLSAPGVEEDFESAYEASLLGEPEEEVFADRPSLGVLRSFWRGLAEDVTFGFYTPWASTPMSFVDRVAWGVGHIAGFLVSAVAGGIILRGISGGVRAGVGGLRSLLSSSPAAANAFRRVSNLYMARVALARSAWAQEVPPMVRTVIRWGVEDGAMAARAYLTSAAVGHALALHMKARDPEGYREAMSRYVEAARESPFAGHVLAVLDPDLYRETFGENALWGVAEGLLYTAGTNAVLGGFARWIGHSLRQSERLRRHLGAARLAVEQWFAGFERSLGPPPSPSPRMGPANTLDDIVQSVRRHVLQGHSVGLFRIGPQKPLEWAEVAMGLGEAGPAARTALASALVGTVELATPMLVWAQAEKLLRGEGVDWEGTDFVSAVGLGLGVGLLSSGRFLWRSGLYGTRRAILERIGRTLRENPVLAQRAAHARSLSGAAWRMELGPFMRFSTIRAGAHDLALIETIREWGRSSGLPDAAWAAYMLGRRHLQAIASGVIPGAPVGMATKETFERAQAMSRAMASAGMAYVVAQSDLMGLARAVGLTSPELQSMFADVVRYVSAGYRFERLPSKLVRDLMGKDPSDWELSDIWDLSAAEHLLGMIASQGRAQRGRPAVLRVGRSSFEFGELRFEGGAVWDPGAVEELRIVTSVLEQAEALHGLSRFEALGLFGWILRRLEVQGGRWGSLSDVERRELIRGWVDEYKSGTNFEAEAYKRQVSDVLLANQKRLEALARAGALRDTFGWLHQAATLRELDDIVSDLRRGVPREVYALIGGEIVRGELVGIEPSPSKNVPPLGVFAYSVQLPDGRVGTFRTRIRLWEAEVTRSGEVIRIPSVIAPNAEALKELRSAWAAIPLDERPALAVDVARRLGSLAPGPGGFRIVHGRLSRGEQAAVAGLLRVLAESVRRKNPYQHGTQEWYAWIMQNIPVDTLVSGRYQRKWVRAVLNRAVEVAEGVEAIHWRGDRALEVDFTALREVSRVMEVLLGPGQALGAPAELWRRAGESVSAMTDEWARAGAWRAMGERLLLHTARALSFLGMDEETTRLIQDRARSLADALASGTPDDVRAQIYTLVDLLSQSPWTAWVAVAGLGHMNPNRTGSVFRYTGRTTGYVLSEERLELTKEAAAFGREMDIIQAVEEALYERGMAKRLAEAAALMMGRGHVSKRAFRSLLKADLPRRVTPEEVRDMVQSENPHIPFWEKLLGLWSSDLATPLVEDLSHVWWQTTQALAKQLDAQNFMFPHVFADQYIDEVMAPVGEMWKEHVGSFVRSAIENLWFGEPEVVVEGAPRFKEIVEDVVVGVERSRGKLSAAGGIAGRAWAKLRRHEGFQKAVGGAIEDILRFVPAGISESAVWDRAERRFRDWVRGWLQGGAVSHDMVIREIIEAVAYGAGEVVRDIRTRELKAFLTGVGLREGGLAYERVPISILLERAYPFMGFIVESRPGARKGRLPAERQMAYRVSGEYELPADVRERRKVGYYEHPYFEEEVLLQSQRRVASGDIFRWLLDTWRKLVTALSPGTKAGNMWTNMLHIFALARMPDGWVTPVDSVLRFARGVQRILDFDDVSEALPEMIVETGAALNRFGEAPMSVLIPVLRQEMASVQADVRRGVGHWLGDALNAVLTLGTRIQHSIVAALSNAGAVGEALRAGISILDYMRTHPGEKRVFVESFRKPEILRLEYLYSDLSLHMAVLGDLIQEVERSQGVRFRSLRDAIRDPIVMGRYREAKVFLPDYGRYDPGWAQGLTQVLPFSLWRAEVARIYTLAALEKPRLALALYWQGLAFRQVAGLLGALAVLGGVIAPDDPEARMQWAALQEDVYQLADFLGTWGSVLLPVQVSFGDTERTLFYVNVNPLMLMGDYTPLQTPYREGVVLPLYRAGSNFFGPLPRLVDAFAGRHAWGTKFVEEGDTWLESVLKRGIIIAATISPQADYFLGILRDMHGAIERAFGPQTDIERLQADDTSWVKDVLRRSRVLGEPRLSEDVVLDILGKTALRTAGVTLGVRIVPREVSATSLAEYYGYIVRELKSQRTQELSRLYGELSEALREGRDTSRLAEEIRRVYRQYTYRIARYEIAHMVGLMGDTDLLDRYLREVFR